MAASAISPPVVDLRDFANRKAEITQQLMEAATSIGFLYVTGHGIDQELIDSAFSHSEKFFDRPQEYKDSLPNIGWSEAKVLGYESQSLPEGTVHESIIHRYDCHEEMAQVWPREQDQPGYRGVTTNLMMACNDLSSRLLRCFAAGIGQPEDFFEQATDVRSSDNRTFLQYHKYPTTEGMEYQPGSLRLTAHTDESVMTLLFTTPGSVGLEVAAGSWGRQDTQREYDSIRDGIFDVDRWVDFPHREGCIIVNLGDPLQMWSDGALRSNFHRVRLPKEGEPRGTRYSIGYFVWPSQSTVIQGRTGKYRPQTMAEFMAVKGKIYDACFSRQPDALQDVQEITFGFPATHLQGVQA